MQCANQEWDESRAVFEFDTCRQLFYDAVSDFAAMKTREDGVVPMKMSSDWAELSDMGRG